MALFIRVVKLLSTFLTMLLLLVLFRVSRVPIRIARIVVVTRLVRQVLVFLLVEVGCLTLPLDSRQLLRVSAVVVITVGLLFSPSCNRILDDSEGKVFLCMSLQERRDDIGPLSQNGI